MLGILRTVLGRKSPRGHQLPVHKNVQALFVANGLAASRRKGYRINLGGVVRQNQIAGRRLILWLIAGQDNSCWLRSSSRFDRSR
jgi:hypothetical protein